MRLMLIFLLSIMSAQLSAQTYGNEWISYDQRYYAFPVVQTGIHKIEHAALINAGVPLETINSTNFQLFGKEKEIPLHIVDNNDGFINGGDYLLFYAEANDGWLDSTLYDDPDWIGNPRYSLYSDTLQYFLTWNSSNENLRFEVETANDFENYTPTDFVIEEEFNFEIINNIIKPLKTERNLAIIALVGDKMKNHQGISGKMFSVFGFNNINVKAISQGASERNITAVISQKDVKKALNTLHEKFFEKNIKQLNLFVTGVGNVGRKLLEQISKQENYLKKNLQIQIKIVGISNSRKMIFKKSGLNIDNWSNELIKGKKANESYSDVLSNEGEGKEEREG